MVDLQIKHRFVSAVADGGNTSLVQPSDWNANMTGNGSLAGLVVFSGNGTTPFGTIVIAGTSNQVTVANGNGTANITLSLPQNIHSGASPTFAGMLLSGLTANRVLTTDANKTLTSSSVTDTELGYLSGVSSAIQTQLNAKQPTIDANTSLSIANITVGGQTASRVPYFDSNKTLMSSSVTATELGYLSGVSSAIQTQLDAKQATITSATNLTAGNLTLAGPANGSVACIDATGKITNTTLSGLTFNSTTNTLTANGGTPAGNNTFVQFNSNGAFAGSANLTYDSANKTLHVLAVANTAVDLIHVQNSGNDTWSASDISIGRGDGVDEKGLIRYMSQDNALYLFIAGDSLDGGVVVRRKTATFTLEVGSGGKFRSHGWSDSSYSTDVPAGAVIGSIILYDAAGTEIGLIEVKART